MKILLDACIWAGARDALGAAGHEVECVADWRADPGDEQVLAHAAEHRQVLVTLDKDFGELAIVREQTHPWAGESGGLGRTTRSVHAGLPSGGGRHHVRVAAPAAITLAAAREMSLGQSPVVRAVIRARELILGATPGEHAPRRVLLVVGG